MKTLFPLFVVFITAVCVVRADETAVATAPTANTAAGVPPKVELKHTSSFAADSASRNPFWPIGYKPATKAGTPTAEHAGPEIPVNAFSVTSIALDSGTRFAIINGKAMTEGQQFGLKFGAQIYQITVKSIEDGQVTLARRDQQIIVPLRRK